MVCLGQAQLYKPRRNGYHEAVNFLREIAMSRFWLAVFGFALAPVSASAALDPELNAPYQLCVVLRLPESRVFTKLFRDQTRSGLQDILQAALGKVGEVEVVDARSPGPARALMEQVKAKGLQQGLDEWQGRVSAGKTHFVLVDFVDGRYVIRTRQFDGLTGLASPLVREARTDQRELVVRLAALLIGQDFGVVGTVEANSTGKEVNVLLKGGGLGPLGQWVKKDEVFAVAQIKQTSTGLRSFRIDETLLQVLEEPQQGVCRCRLLHRYDTPLPAGPRVLGYRCFKLGTTEAHLRLRLVDLKGRPPRTLYQIHVSRDEFGAEPREDRSINAEGFFESEGTYKNVAFVQILRPGKVLANIPVEILSDRPVVCYLDTQGKTEQFGQLELDRKSLLNRLDESRLAVNELFKELNARARNSEARAEALKKAEDGLLELEGDLATYRNDMVRLRQAKVPDLATLESRLQHLKDRQKQFRHYIADLKDIIRQEKDPRRAQLKKDAVQAQALVDDARFEEAIALYEKVVKEGGNQPFVAPYAKRLEDLKRAWAIKGPEHKAARDFITKTWPTLQSADQLKANLDKVKQAFQTCKQAGDKLTPLILLKANTEHVNRLAKRLDTILASTSAEDKQEGQTIIDVQEELGKLTTEVGNFLRPPEAAR
jgi:hypothetical protein